MEFWDGYLLSDNSIYEGQWSRNDCRMGLGKCLYSDNSFYHGYWLDGIPFKLGWFISSDGYITEGLIKNGKINGKGVWVGLNNYKYVGYFKNGKKDG